MMRSSSLGGGYFEPCALDKRNDIAFVHKYFSSLEKVQDMTILMISTMLRTLKLIWEPAFEHIKRVGDQNAEDLAQFIATGKMPEKFNEAEENLLRDVQQLAVDSTQQARIASDELKKKKKKSAVPVSSSTFNRSLIEEKVNEKAVAEAVVEQTVDEGADQQAQLERLEAEKLRQQLLSVKLDTIRAEIRNRIPNVRTHIHEPLKVGLIGCGRLGTAILQDLIAGGGIKAANLQVSTRRFENLHAFSKLGVQCYFDNVRLVQECPIVLLGFLPHQLPAVAASLDVSHLTPASALASQATTDNKSASIASSAMNSHSLLHTPSQAAVKSTSGPTFHYPEAILSALGPSVRSVTCNLTTAPLQRHSSSGKQTAGTEAGTEVPDSENDKENTHINSGADSIKNISPGQESTQPSWMKEISAEAAEAIRSRNAEKMREKFKNRWLTCFSEAQIGPTVLPPSTLYFSLLSSVPLQEVSQSVRSDLVNRLIVPLPHISKSFFSQDCTTSLKSLFDRAIMQMRYVIHLECHRYLARYSPFTDDRGVHEDLDRVVNAAESSMRRDLETLVALTQERSERTKLLVALMFPPGTQQMKT
jgi:hypothetical protein